MEIHSKLNIALLCAASMVALAPAAVAQSTDGQTGETVVVTGSRVTSAANSPTPLTVVSTDQLLATTPSTIPDALAKLPAFIGSGSQRTFSNSSSNGAAATVNLRGLGSQRSLLLVDGHRWASNDTDTLPQMFIQRVDVVTGGASAVYGSDAVAGVVNYILDKHFTGLKYNASAGISNYADAAEYQAGIAVGTDLFNGRAHIEASVRYYNQDAVRMNQRWFSQGGQAWGLTGQGTAASPYVITPYERQTVQGESAHIIACGQPITAPVSAATASTSCPAYNMQFVQNGIIGPYNPGLATGTGGVSSGGDGAWDSDAAFQASLRNFDTFTRFSYDLDDTTTAYVNFSGTQAYNFNTWDEFNLNPSTIRPNTFFVNNPYIPAAAQALLANPTGKFSIAGRIATYINGAPAVDQNETYDTISNNQNYNVTTGIDGSLFGKYDWSLYYTHGYGRDKVNQPNNTNNQKLYAAMDAVLNSAGNPVCYVSTTPYANLYPGCVPISPFGPDDMTNAQYRYISQDNWFTEQDTMDDAGASIAGNVFDLPAGPVKAALSGEMRWMDYVITSNLNPTQLVDCTGLRLCNPATSITVQSAVAPVSASENVWEFAGEVNVPLLKDLPLIQSLSTDIAGRYTDYSVSGPVETWKIGLDYHVNDSVRFRGTASVDIRAPTLADLYAPEKATNSGFHDYLTNQTFSVVSISQGNSSLKPEIAHDYTVGVVLTPDFLPGFTTSLDYVRFNISGAISSISYSNQTVQNLCMASGASGNSIYCTLVDRPHGFTSTASDNFPTAVYSMNLNSASIKTEAFDYEANYGFQMSDIDASLPGSVNTRLILTYQPDFTTVNFPGSPPTFSTVPKGRATMFVGYNIGSWGINLQDTWYSPHTKISTPGQVYVQPIIPSFNQIDMTIDKQVTVSEGVFDIYLNIENFLNARPPLDPSATSTPGNGVPIDTYESALGRYFRIGIRGNL